MREASFWTIAALLAVFLVFLDRVVLFVDFPRWIFSPTILLFLSPSRVNRTYWFRWAVVAALCTLPVAGEPVRWSNLKSFYLDCESLESR